MTRMSIIFTALLQRVPIIEPAADFAACLKSLATMYSPMNAPSTGPRIKPHGAKKSPTNIPITSPIVPAFVALNFFAPTYWAMASSQLKSLLFLDVQKSRKLLCQKDLKR